VKTCFALLHGLLALALTAGTGQARAEDEPIATDRPDFVESSDVVGKGRFQLETSVAFERDRQGTVKARLASTPTLLRLGLGETWELRFETDGRLRLRADEAGVTTRENGWSDLSVGVKWHQRDGDEETGTPGLGWLFHVDMDSGSGSFRGQGLRPSLRFVAEWEFAGGWTAGVMPGIYRDRDENGQHFVGAILAGTLGKSLTDKLRGFVEVSGQQLASNRHGGSVVTFDTGLAYLLDRDLQVDVALSRGINKNAPDLAWTVGISARF
jgi:hypothetical protein